MKNEPPKYRGPGPRASPCEGRGFTLPELIMTVTIVGILCVTAEAFFSGFTEYKLDAAARRIASAIRYLQERAMENHGDHRIVFDTAQNRYALYAMSPSAHLLKDPFTGQDFIVDLDEEIDSGIALASVSFGGSQLTFDSKGAPSSGGTIQITASKMKKTVTVVQETGLVRIADGVAAVE